LGKNLPIIGFEMWYVFDFFFLKKITVIIVQNKLKLYDLTVVGAGDEL